MVEPPLGDAISTLHTLSFDSLGGVGICNAVVVVEIGDVTLFVAIWKFSKELEDETVGEGSNTLL